MCFCATACHCVFSLCVSVCTLKVRTDLACLFLSACLVRTLIVSCQRFSIELKNVYMTLLPRRLCSFWYEMLSSLLEKNVSFRVHRLYILLGKRNFWKVYFIIECLNFAYPLRLTKLLKDSQQGLTIVITKHETALHKVWRF